MGKTKNKRFYNNVCLYAVKKKTNILESLTKHNRNANLGGEREKERKFVYLNWIGIVE